MRLKAKVDDNQKEITAALRKLGCSVQILSQIGKGCPDILIGYKGRNYLVEIKDGKKVPSARKLTPDEKDWHEAWQGQICIIESLQDISNMVLTHFN